MINIIEKLYSRISPKNENGCRNYNGPVHTGGYGIFNGRKEFNTLRAHRIIWIINHGEIPQGLLVCHHCDNRICCEISHLFLGTHSENTRDMMNKNRGHFKSGRSNKYRILTPSAKLTENQVKQIKLMIAAGIRGAVIAKQYQVDNQAIYNIKNGKSWKHVTI